MTDGNDKSASRSPVGYRKPPEQHRFKKGVSGNPAGRPRKSVPKQQFHGAALEELVLREAYRPITLRENGELVELPMIQAVLRSLGLAAVKGSHRAQIAITQMISAVEAKQYEVQRGYVLAMLEYKEVWKEEFDRCDENGEPRPDPFPHPDDVQVDLNTGEVIYNGPYLDSQKVAWNKLKERREDAIQENADLERLTRRQPGRREVFERIIAANNKIIKMVDDNFPDEQTRRVPGFNINDWRKGQAKIQKLKEQFRRERTRSGEGE